MKMKLKVWEVAVFKSVSLKTIFDSLILYKGRCNVVKVIIKFENNNDEENLVTHLILIFRTSS